MIQLALSFDGPEEDDKTFRLNKQLTRVWKLMRDGRWRTLEEISTLTGDPPASVSAQLRHLRKVRFGKHTVKKEYLGEGLYRYKVIPNPLAPILP